MGAGSAGTSNDSGGKDTKTPFGTASSTKTKTKFGYSKPPSKIKSFLEGGGIIGSVTKPFREKSLEVNTKFFNEKVVPAGKIKKGTTYESYMKDRLAGKTDAYGNVNPNFGQDKGNNNQPVIIQKNVGGQTVQTTEAKVEEDKKEATQYDERVTKKKGRSKNILTSKQGVMKTSADYSLGKKSLLGQVV